MKYWKETGSQASRFAAEDLVTELAPRKSFDISVQQAKLNDSGKSWTYFDRLYLKAYPQSGEQLVEEGTAGDEYTKLVPYRGLKSTQYQVFEDEKWVIKEDLTKYLNSVYDNLYRVRNSYKYANVTYGEYVLYADNKSKNAVTQCILSCFMEGLEPTQVATLAGQQVEAWKCANGYIAQPTYAQMQEIAALYGAVEQKCFRLEEQLRARYAAMTIDELVKVDVADDFKTLWEA